MKRVDRDFNEIVQYLLKSHNQTELSKKTKVHQGVISDLNKGVLKPNLSYRYGAALAKAYDAQIKKENRL